MHHSQNTSRLQRVCTLCQTGNLGNEQHLVFKCPALQGVRDGDDGLFGDRSPTMVRFMWQHDTSAVAIFIEARMDAHGHPGQASDQPQVAGCDVKFFFSSPLYLIYSLLAHLPTEVQQLYEIISFHRSRLQRTILKWQGTDSASSESCRRLT